jgi:hypothetical protein
MAARVFKGAEHEFLRMAALAQPDWEGIRSLIQEGISWEALEEVGARHQLDGVLSWRLLAPELGGTVPTAAQERRRSRLADLSTMKAPWQEQQNTLRKSKVESRE